MAALRRSHGHATPSLRSGRPWMSSVREGQTFSGSSALSRWASFVKLPHTVFALPFALLGVLAASRIAPVSWRIVLLVVVAFTAARFAAMGFNRITDRVYDVRNPRTSNREIPKGVISVGAATVNLPRPPTPLAISAPPRTKFLVDGCANLCNESLHSPSDAVHHRRESAETRAPFVPHCSSCLRRDVGTNPRGCAAQSWTWRQKTDAHPLACPSD